MTVSEAMWKGQPVIGGNVGGIKTQIDDGVNGFLVSTPEECGERIVQLIRDESLRLQMGGAARESVRQRFLLPRLAVDYLKAAQSLIAGQANGQIHRLNGQRLDAFEALEQMNFGSNPAKPD